MAKNKLNDIYTGYFQKSRVFLWPALGIKKMAGIKPVETYMCWEDKVDITDNKLICLYELQDSDEFRIHEEVHLLGNRLFEDYIEVDDRRAVYVFNYDDYAEDYTYVVKARYSLLSLKLKTKIRDVYGVNSPEYKYIKSYLYPHAYYENYAEILSPQTKYIKEMQDILEQTIELCSKPNTEREMLKIQVKSLNL